MQKTSANPYKNFVICSSYIICLHCRCFFIVFVKAKEKKRLSLFSDLKGHAGLAWWVKYKLEKRGLYHPMKKHTFI